MTIHHDLLPPTSLDYQPVEIAGGLKDKKKWPKKFGRFVNAMLTKGWKEELEVYPEISFEPSVEQQEESAQEQKYTVERQVDSEASYAITISPAAYTEQLSPQEIIDRMEIDHVVKDGPHLVEQLEDDRPNIVNYRDSNFQKDSLTEHEALNELHLFLETVVTSGEELGGKFEADAKSILDSLTFIGEKEYQEAASGIALYWKTLLDTHPDQQILAFAGVDNEFGYFRDKKHQIKSDDYLLDNVLAYFSDEEVQKYKGRLITDSSEITAKDANDLRVILLDDWTISGDQLQDSAARFRRRYPQFASSIEIQLIVAVNKRIMRGLEKNDFDSSANSDLPVPVRAYFRAHDAPQALYASGHITGSHSTVDFDFESPVRKIVTTARKTDTLNDEQRDILCTMPALGEIIRPYRSDGARLVQKDRFSQST